jgi:iron complex outermembrane receptor protein
MDERNKSHWKNVDVSEYYDNIGYKTDINAFAGTTAHLGNWTLGANLQYRHVDFSYTDKMNNVHLSSGDMKTNWNFVNGGIDIMYNINKNHHVYAKLAVSNREPMRSDMFGGDECIYPDSLGNIKLTNELKSELVHDVELGWEGKGSIFKANVNLYYMHFKNELILNGNLGLNGLPGHVNADNSFRTGAEVSFDVEPVKGLHLVNSTSYAYGKVNKANVCNNATHIFFPAWTLFQDIHYDTKVGDVAVTVGANYDLRSKIYLDLDNQYSLPTNMALNVYGSLTFRDRIELSLHLNNITNHVNYSYGSVNGNGDILYVQESKFNCLGSVKFYF